RKEASLEKAVSKLRAVQEVLAPHVQQLSTEEALLATSKSELTKQVVTLQNQVEKLDSDRRELEDGISQLTGQKQSLLQTLAGIRDQQAEDKAIIQSSEDRIKGMHGMLTDLHSQRNALDDEVKCLRAEQSERQSFVSELREAEEKLGSAVALLKT